MISKEMAIEVLKGLKEIFVPKLLKANHEGMGEINAKEFAETMDLAVVALEKQLNGGWIPVSERLSDNNEHILLFLKDEKGEIAQVVGYLYHSDNKNFEKLNGEFKAFDGDELMPNFLKKECVIAWQPLLESYKEVEH